MGDVCGADGVGGLAVDEDAFLEEGDDFCNADAVGKFYDAGIEGADAGGVDDGGLAALEDFCDFFGGAAADGCGDAGGHDFALKGPVVEFFEVAAEDSEDEFYAEIFEDGEVEEGFCDGGLWEEVCLDEDAEDFPPELGDVLEDGTQVTFLDHGGEVSGSNADGKCNARIQEISARGCSVESSSWVSATGFLKRQSLLQR